MTRKWGGTRRRKYEELRRRSGKCIGACLVRKAPTLRASAVMSIQPASQADGQENSARTPNEERIANKTDQGKKRPGRCLKNYGRREGVSTAWLARFRCHRNYHIWTRLFSRSLRGSMSLLPNDSPFFCCSNSVYVTFFTRRRRTQKGGHRKRRDFSRSFSASPSFSSNQNDHSAAAAAAAARVRMKIKKERKCGSGTFSLSLSLSFFFLFFSIRSWLPHGGNVYIPSISRKRRRGKKVESLLACCCCPVRNSSFCVSFPLPHVVLS